MTRDQEVMARALLSQAQMVIKISHEQNPMQFTERWLRIADRFVGQLANFDLTTRQQATLDLMLHEDAIQ